MDQSPRPLDDETQGNAHKGNVMRIQDLQCIIKEYQYSIAVDGTKPRYNLKK